MADRDPIQPSRRGFLAGAAVGSTALLGGAAMAQGAPATPGRAPAPPLPSREAESGSAPAARPRADAVPGSDYMVDVLRSLGIEHVASVAGTTVRGLHESIVNHGMTSAPALDFIHCLHEEVSVAFCHGYAKVEGKPMACMMHSTVGLQHGAMALYNAWADRVPLVCLVGAHLDAAKRANMVSWEHAVFDGPGLVRDFTKWDDTPVSLTHFAESAARAHDFAMTPPYGPVVLALDQSLQLGTFAKSDLPRIPRMSNPSPPRGDDNAVREVARLLVAAQSPVIVADRAARTPAGMALLVELAETLQAAVVDQNARFNFPWRHPLNQSVGQAAALAGADAILGLEVTDFYDATAAAAGAKRMSISSESFYMKSNYQDFNRYTDVDLALAADAEATLPALIEAVKRLSPRGSARDARGKALADAHRQDLARSREVAAIGWDDSPISVPRMCMELYGQIKDEDWALVNGTIFQSFWPQKLWTATRHHQYIGDAGAYGLGYLPGASLGAALAHRKHGRLAVCIGGDGDLMFTPGALWTAAHERIPILYVVHNNRAYHAEVMQVQMVANARDRGIDRTRIGNAITDPDIDFAALARSMGVHGEGPIADPKELGPALRRAIEVVKRGEPAVVDVISQGR